jgi:hypothetical protein
MIRVRQSDPFNRQVRRRVIVLTIFGAVVALLFLYPHASSTAFEPQGRRRQPQKRTSTATPSTPTATETQTRTGRNSPSRFDHSQHRSDDPRSPVSKLKCTSCHTITSPARPDAISAATKPGIVGYPYHDSCVGCHRQEFFKGAAPPICTICHTRSSPRLTARDMHPFPKQGEVAREFPGYFPHGLHQGVIARNERPAPNPNGEWSFVRASFNPDEAKPKAIDNCATCHVPDQRTPVAIKVGGTEGTITPEKGVFETIPTGHASCFTCHWQSEKADAHFPTKDACDKCHLPEKEYLAKKRAASPNAPLPGELSAKAAQWFKDWPKDWPKRLSIKFNHVTPTEHNVGCTTCHINITLLETLTVARADVPLTTCAYCHVKNKNPVLHRKDGQKDVTVTFEDEMNDEAKDTDNKNHTCVACHTSLIGSERPPCSHYLLLGRKCGS